MANFRKNKINEEVKKELSFIIRELKDPRIPEFVSVVSAEVTPDMKFAKIYVSVIGDEKVKTDAVKGLNSAKGFVRREIASRLKLRNSPEFNFVCDDSIDHGLKIAEILSGMNIKHNEEEDEADD